MYTIDVLGTGWYGQVIGTSYTAPADVPEESIEDWLDSHSGDFQSITDFCAVRIDRCSECGHHSKRTTVRDWADEENAGTYHDMLCPFDDVEEEEEEDSPAEAEHRASMEAWYEGVARAMHEEASR